MGRGPPENLLWSKVIGVVSLESVEFATTGWFLKPGSHGTVNGYGRLQLRLLDSVPLQLLVLTLIG